MRWLLPRLRKFREERPDIEVRPTTSNVPIDELADTFDVVIRGGPDTFHGFTSRLFLSERRLPVCSPALISIQPLKDVSDLARHTLLNVTSVPRLWHDWLSEAGRPHLASASALTFDRFFSCNPGGAGWPWRSHGSHRSRPSRCRCRTSRHAVSGDQPSCAQLLRLRSGGEQIAGLGALRLVGGGRCSI